MCFGNGFVYRLERNNDRSISEWLISNQPKSPSKHNVRCKLQIVVSSTSPSPFLFSANVNQLTFLTRNVFNSFALFICNLNPTVTISSTKTFYNCFPIKRNQFTSAYMHSLDDRYRSPLQASLILYCFIFVNLMFWGHFYSRYGQRRS